MTDDLTGLLIAGPISGPFSKSLPRGQTAPRGGPLDHVHNVAQVFKEASRQFGRENILLSTWQNSESQSFRYLMEEAPDLRMDLTPPPARKPYVTQTSNPSKNMFHRTKAVLSGLIALEKQGIQWVWKIRTDHRLSNYEAMASFNKSIGERGHLYVKNFRPAVPCMFSDGIQFGHVGILVQFYSALMYGPQLYNNVHFNDFFHLVGICDDSSGDTVPFFNEEPLSFDHEVGKQIEALWRSRLRLIPEDVLFPHWWKGVRWDSHLQEPLEMGFGDFGNHHVQESVTNFVKPGRKRFVSARLGRSLMRLMVRGGLSQSAKRLYAILKKLEWNIAQTRQHLAGTLKQLPCPTNWHIDLK